MIDANSISQITQRFLRAQMTMSPRTIMIPKPEHVQLINYRVIRIDLSMTENRLLIIERDCHSATAAQSSGSLKCCWVPSRIKIWICNMPPHSRTKPIHYPKGDQLTPHAGWFEIRDRKATRCFAVTKELLKERKRRFLPESTTAETFVSYILVYRSVHLPRLPL